MIVSFDTIKCSGNFPDLTISTIGYTDPLRVFQPKLIDVFFNTFYLLFFVPTQTF